MLSWRIHSPPPYPPPNPTSFPLLPDPASLLSLLLPRLLAPLNPSPSPSPSPTPRRAHRRSQSDIPLGFLPNHQSVKQESENIAADGLGDDLFDAYMNLDSFDTLNSSGTEEKREESEDESESSVNESGNSGQGNKRSAMGDLGQVNAARRHCRSISMDSFMGKLNFGDVSPKLPPPSPTMNASGLELGNGEFNSAEMKKIMANEKLAELALSDPKRVKRILANRQSAARSKERKMRYISELEHKVQTLQTEATTLSAQLTLLQRDSAGLTSQNNELKFRLQAMEQQAQLRDALNEALTAEVQRLKLAVGEITEANLSKGLSQKVSLNSQMFQMQQLQIQQQQHQQTQQQHLQQTQQQHHQQAQQLHHQQTQQQHHQQS
ncbi:bZIP transcription factor 29-like [Typha latifolia]|uniref:bZIP transcription factor 29-like n=1 Tax=Typha latifolia TaxID=4733 RepID=UPI003C2F55E8